MSNPVLRMQIIGKMQECGAVTCRDLDELRQFFGLECVSTTQFKRALGSVQYKHRVLRVSRPSEDLRTYEEKPYVVKLVSDAAADRALHEAKLELALV